MCGIAGYVTARPSSPNRAPLERMTDTIRHRGPDESGYYHDPQASLGHRRLSIIDLAAGQQPMTNEDGALWIVYNGEIFNHADLRARAGTGRPPLPDALRYRNHSARLRAVRAGVPEALPRHVRVRHLGQARAHASSARATGWASSPSTITGTAACSPSPPKSRRCSSIPRFRPRFEESLLPEYLAFGYISERAHAVLRHPQADAGALAHARRERRPAGARNRAATGTFPQPGRARPTPMARRRILDRRMPPAPGRDRPHAPDERRAAGHVPQRRRRFERHRRAHEAHASRAGQDVLGRIPRGALQRTGLRAAGGATHRHRTPRGGDRHGGFLQRPAASDLARRRADRLALQRLAVLRFAGWRPNR